MKHFDEFKFSGKKVLIRVDFNVPLNEHFEINDDSRIKAAIPTLEAVLSAGGKVILMSHLGRPKGEKSEKYSLSHLLDNLSNHLGKKIDFADDCIGPTAAQKASNLKNGEVLLLENLRFYPEETAGDPTFAKKLADLGEVFVNDAFGTAHREHASTAVIASFFDEGEKCFGKVIEKELEAVDRILKTDARPFTAIMGGAKISDKILLIEKMMDQVDHLIIGGGMSYTFFKALGGEVGGSLVETDKLGLANTILELAKEKEVQLLLPEDSVISSEYSNHATTKEAENLSIDQGWMGLDIGSKAIESFTEVIKKSKTILWNGPMGVFEMEKFERGTKAIAEAICQATDRGAYSLIGGGDSAAAIHQFGLGSRVSYISTGGGALLEYLEGRTLPGIKAIQG